MNVKCLHSADAPLEVIDRLAGNNFFSTTGFAGIWSALGGRPVYWVAEDAGKVAAIMPGVEFGGWLKRMQSMPDGCYSSILFSESVSQDEDKIGALIVTEILKKNYLKIFINDFHKVWVNPPGFEVQPCQTHLVNISPKEWEPLDPKLRQLIHKAERAGLKLEKFSAAKHLDDFMRLVAKHEKRRHVKVRYNRLFFESLAQAAENDKRINWVWCAHDEKPVSSHIFILEGESLIHWQMYYDETCSDLQATKYIPYKIAKEAAERGVRTLNLGASPPEAEGADFYKSKWGGEIYNYNCYVYKNWLGRLL